MKRTDVIDIVLFFTMAIIWGVTWPVLVIALRYFSPMSLAAGRNIVGAFALGCVLIFQKKERPRSAKEILFYSGLGIVWITIPYAMAYWALQYTSGGIAAVLTTANTFFVILFSVLFLKEEQLTVPKISGVLLGFLGVLCIFSDKIYNASPMSLTANVVLFISSSFSAFGMVVAKRFTPPTSPYSSTALMMLSAGIVLFALSAGTEHPMRYDFSPAAAGVMLYLGLLSSAVGFYMYMTLLHRVDAVKLSMVGFVVPVISISVGAVWLGESISTNEVIGTLGVFAGLAIVNIKKLFSSH
mgnify:CR=1 FL=1